MLLEAEGPEDDIMKEYDDAKRAKRARHRRAYVQALLPQGHRVVQHEAQSDSYPWTITLH